MAYFDNAATTHPKPECVYQAIDTFNRQHGGSAGRGAYAEAMSAGQLLQKTRHALRDLFHSPDKEVIFTPTATLALNMIIQGMIRSGCRHIYISPFEHNAVTRVLYALSKEYPLQISKLIVNRDLHYDLERIRYQFEEQRPDLVIVSHASNVIGLIAPLMDIFKLAKFYGAYTVADMSQTAGLVDTNLRECQADFAVFAGHKTLYGPMGVSGFLMNRDIRLPPILFGGTGIESANQEMPEQLPARYEMGTMNTAGVAGLYAALQWLKETGLNKLRRQEEQHRQRLIEILSQYDFLHLVGINPEQPYVGVVSALMNGISSDSAGPLFNERGISVRTGLQCAPLAHKFLKTFPAGTIRFSVSYFTSEQDFQELETVLMELADELSM